MKPLFERQMEQVWVFVQIISQRRCLAGDFAQDALDRAAGVRLWSGEKRGGQNGDTRRQLVMRQYRNTLRKLSE